MLTTGYKFEDPKIKLDKDPLQHRVYFLTYVESLEMIFSQYKETHEVLLYYPTIVGEDIKYNVNKVIGNLLHVNIDDHSRTLFDEYQYME